MPLARAVARVGATALADVGRFTLDLLGSTARCALPAGPHFLLGRHILAQRGERPQGGPKGEAAGRVKESKQRKGDDGFGRMHRLNSRRMLPEIFCGSGFSLTTAWNPALQSVVKPAGQDKSPQRLLLKAALKSTVLVRLKPDPQKSSAASPQQAPRLTNCRTALKKHPRKHAPQSAL